MRIEEVRLQVGDRRARLTVHPRLTILGGLPDEARAAVAEALIEALAGAHTDTTLRLMDNAGNTVVVGAGGAEHPDGRTATPVVPDLVASLTALRELLLVRPDTLGIHDGRDAPHLQAELLEARRARSALELELGRRGTQQLETEQVRTEYDALTERVRHAEDYDARIAHRAVEQRVERLRTELTEGRKLAETAALDRKVIQAGKDLAEHEDERDAAGSRGRSARSVIETLRAVLESYDVAAASGGYGDRRPFPADDETGAFALADDWRQAQSATVDAAFDLQAHRADQGTDLHPLVVRLATIHPGDLWDTHRRLVDLEHRLVEVADGVGIGDVAPPPHVAAAIDEAHLDVLGAQAHLERSRQAGLLVVSLLAVTALLMIRRDSAHLTSALSVGLCIGLLLAAAPAAWWLVVRPRHRLDRAVEAERAQLARVGSEDYVELHLRRLPPGTDEPTRKRWVSLVGQRVEALGAWRTLAGSTSLADAASLEAEIRAAGPRLNPAMRARRDEQLATGLERVEASRDLKRQTLEERLEDLEIASIESDRIEAAAVAQAASVLAGLGIPASPEQAREALARARLEAVRRERQRHGIRPSPFVAAELAAAEEEAAQLAKPEWASLPPPRREKHLGLLRRRHEELGRRLAGLEEDPAAMAQRYEVVARSVHDLEIRLDDPLGGADVGQIAQRLLDRVGRVTSIGPLEEDLPLVFDDSLVQMSVDHRLDLLTMLRRVSERVQIVYLTGDETTVEWGRGAAATGTVRVLELSADAAEASEPA